MPSRERHARTANGFTLVEAIIVVAVLGLLLLIGLPSFLGTLNRTRLTGSSRQLATLFQLARLDAIRYSTPAKVVYDSTLRRFSGFLDLDRDGVQDAGERAVGGAVELPVKVRFQGPGESAEGGAEAIDLWDDAPMGSPGPSFQSDGSADRAGAFRISDSHGNILEVRVDTIATGKVVLRKWDPVATKFYAYLEGNKKWEWY
jgi:prepilin-type N-terminal cleavage/methylation domain-containing protein